MMQQLGIQPKLEPIIEEGSGNLAPDLDDPKRKKNDDLKRKALLITNKDSRSKRSSNGLSKLSDTISQGGVSDINSSVQSSTSSDVQPFITGAKLLKPKVEAK